MWALGLECGGTSSAAILVSPEGASEEFRFGPGNFMLLGLRPSGLLQHFQTLSTLISGRVGPIELGRVGVGMAGILTEADRKSVREVLHSVWPSVSQVWVGNDLETALACLGPEEDSDPYDVKLVLISGTGSCAFGTNGTDPKKIGGYGHVMGDRYSGYFLGHEGLRGAVAAYERFGQNPLFHQILDHLGFETIQDLCSWSLKASKTETAALAPVVLEAWTQRDHVAINVVNRALDDILLDVTSLLNQLSPTAGRVKLGLTGSILVENEAFGLAATKLLEVSLKPAQIHFQILRETARGALSRVISPGRTLTSRKGGLSEEALAKLLLPVPRGLSPTESRNPRSMNLHRMPVREAISLWLSEEASLYAEIEKQGPALERLVTKVSQTFRKGGRLFYVGAGTSGRLGVLDASECPPTFKTPPEWVQGIIAGGKRAITSAVEGAEDSISGGMEAVDQFGINSGDVLIGIACSGRTPFVWGSLSRAKELGAFTVLLTFNPNMTLSLVPDEALVLDLGPEILTGSTRLKCGTATKVILNLLSTLSMVRLGKCHENLMVDLKPTNEKLRGRALRIVSSLLEGEGTGIGQDRIQEVMTKNGFDIKRTLEELKESPIN